MTQQEAMSMISGSGDADKEMDGGVCTNTILSLKM